VGEQGGELLELPLLSPRVNRLFRQGKLVLEANGRLTGDVTEIRFGASAVSSRGALLKVPGPGAAEDAGRLSGYPSGQLRVAAFGHRKFGRVRQTPGPKVVVRGRQIRQKCG
jgi:hypothetical protein